MHLTAIPGRAHDAASRGNKGLTVGHAQSEALWLKYRLAARRRRAFVRRWTVLLSLAGRRAVGGSRLGCPLLQLVAPVGMGCAPLWRISRRGRRVRLTAGRTILGALGRRPVTLPLGRWPANALLSRRRCVLALRRR